MHESLANLVLGQDVDFVRFDKANDSLVAMIHYKDGRVDVAHLNANAWVVVEKIPA